ncbi:hypothetical protein ACFU99_13625 [Streptomyces sp. NPDC057654]|uniref:hypothetical protein n=1 Tax=Streptomyces sp. NPDC057654 TaxID=3346196 RepID=UPI0036D10071
MADSDRNRVRIHGDVFGQVVVGDHNVVINAEAGSSVTYRAEGPPAVRRRARPLGWALPARAPALLARTGELAALGRWLAAGEPVQVHGPPGLGKTALLRAFAADRVARGGAVVHLPAAGLTAEDVVQEIFHACFEVTDYKPELAVMRRLMGSLRGLLIVIDDFDGSPEELADLVHATPGCELLLSSVERGLGRGRPGGTAAEGIGGRPMRLEGLPEHAALDLLVRELGRPLRGREITAARRLVAAVEGHPLTLVQAAAAMSASAASRAVTGVVGQGAYGPYEAFEALATDESVFAVGIAGRLSERAARLLRLLCAFDPLPVSLGLLTVFTGGADRAALAELGALRLAVADGAGYRAVGRLAVLVAERVGPPRQAADFAAPLVAWVRTRATPQQTAAESAAIGRVLESACWAGHHTAVRDLARAAAPALARSLRWGAWRQALELGERAALEIGAAHDAEYFAHERDVRRRALAAGFGALAGGGGGGYALAAAHHGVPGVGPAPGPQPVPSSPAPSSPGGVPSQLKGDAPGGRSGRLRPKTKGRSGLRGAMTHPAAVGAAVAAVVAGGVLAAAFTADGDRPEVPAPAISSATAAGLSPPAVTKGGTSGTSGSSGATGGSTAGPSDGSSSGPSSPGPSPSGRDPSASPSSGTCTPVGLPAEDFGQVAVGQSVTRTVRFDKWLPCDDENSLSVSDEQGVVAAIGSRPWRTALNACPPPAGSRLCLFDVTFRPTRPGAYRATVTMLDDWGQADVSMTVSGVAVEDKPTGPTGPTKPTEPTEPTGPTGPASPSAPTVPTEATKTSATAEPSAPTKEPAPAPTRTTRKPGPEKPDPEKSAPKKPDPEKPSEAEAPTASQSPDPPDAPPDKRPDPDAR